MKKTFLTILYIAAALSAISCAKTEVLGPNDAYKRYFEAWMHINHPEAQATGIGIYIIEDKQGNGAAVGEKGYALIDYKVTDLEGNISSYTDAMTAKQLGAYDQTSYYGPKFWTTVETTLPAGVREALVGAPVGTYRKVIIPSWLMSYKAYINKWQIDSIGRFFANKTVRIDGKPAFETFVTDNGAQMTTADSVSTGFYYKQLSAPTDTTAFAKDTTIYINYVGKLLNGLVFDSNIERVAKDNGLYSATRSYEPVKINWGEKYSDITMGSDKTSMIAGFAKTLWEMRAMEKGVGVFYSNLGYTHSGSGSSIPGYAPLIFEIEIVAKPKK